MNKFLLHLFLLTLSLLLQRNLLFSQKNCTKLQLQAFSALNNAYSASNLEDPIIKETVDLFQEVSICYEENTVLDTAGLMMEEIPWLLQYLGHPEAEAYFEKALKVYEKAAKYYWKRDNEKWRVAVISMAVMAGYTEDDPISILEEAVKNAEAESIAPKGLARLQANLGWELDRVGNFFEARETFEKALQYQDEAKEDPVILQIYKPLGNIYTRLGDIPKAITYLNKATSSSYLKAANLDSLRTVILHQDILGDLGIAYQTGGRFEEAIKTYDLALQEIQSIYTNKPSGIDSLLLNSRVRLLQNKVTCLLFQSKTPAALNVASTIPMQAPAMSKDTYIGALQIMGQVNFENSLYQEAERYLQTALEEAKAYFLNRREIGKIALSLGDLYQKQGRQEGALEFYNQALQAVIPSFKGGKSDAIDPSKFYPENVILDALTAKGEVYHQLALNNATEKVENLGRAKEQLLLALDMEKILTDTYSSESPKLQMAAESQSRHELLLSILFELAPNAQIQEEILQCIERSKALVYRDQLLASKALNEASSRIDTAILDGLTALNQQINQTKAELSNLQREDDTSNRDRLVQELVRLIEERESITKIIGELDEKYYNARFGNNELSLKQIKKLSGRTKSLIIEFFYGKRHIFVIAIAGRKVITHKIERSAEWEQHFDQYLSIVNNKAVRGKDRDVDQFNAFVSVASYLYQSLLEPILANVRRYSSLVMIPDGDLFRLPFDVLLRDDTGSSNVSVDKLPGAYGKLSYLFKKSPIQYNYSISNYLYPTSRQSNSQRGLEKYVGFAPNYSACDQELNTYESSRESVRKTASLLGGSAIMGDTATRESFLKLGFINDYVHYHGHAYADTISYFQSYLKFGCSVDNTRTTTELYAYELYGMSMQAALVAIGGCEGAAGTILPGEGIMSLGKAFQYAGAENVLMNLWVIDDEVTSEINSLFFEQLKEGDSYPKALQNARLRYLKQSSNHPHPYFLGPPVLLSSSIDPPNNNWFFWGIGVAGLAFFLLLWKNRRSKTNLSAMS